MTISQKQAAELRKPFAPSAVGKLPRSTCRECSQSQRKRCDRHEWVSRCDICHGSHSSATLHLDYVGHAATTDRLLAVDPEWTWEPLAYDVATGLPSVDRAGNLWIKLTVCGVTRLGVGDGKNAKECIGDAIRNAAMRFGVALDLWSKDELEQVTIGADRLRAALFAQPQQQSGGLGAALADQGNSEAPSPASEVGEGGSEDQGDPPPGPASEPPTTPRTEVVGQDRQPPARPIAAGARRALMAQLSRFDLASDEARPARLAIVSVLVGREIESTSKLTSVEGQDAVTALSSCRDRAALDEMVASIRAAEDGTS